MRAHAHNLGTQGLQLALLRFGDGCAVNRVLVLEPNSQVFDFLLHRRGHQVAHRGHRGGGKGAAVGAAAKEVGQATVNQRLRQGIGFPINFVVAQSSVAGRERDAAQIRAHEQVHFVAADQLLDHGNALLRCAGVAAHQLDLAPEQAASGVDLVHRQFIAPGDLIAVQGHGAAVGVDGPDLQGLLCPQGCGHKCGRDGQSCATAPFDVQHACLLLK